jgi:hypothetical protein
MNLSYKIIFLFLFFISSSFATIINVPADQPSIQAGINAAVSGDTVLVADSTYIENINFKGKSIAVASHFYIDGDTSHISNTIIDGSNPSNPDSGSVVSFISGEDTTSVLYGFTIKYGTGTITQTTYAGVVYPAREGGGVFCYNSGARISHNKILENNIPNYNWAGGGGVSGFPNGSVKHVIIENNQISNNTINGENSASGSGVLLTCNGILLNNEISYNTTNSNGYAGGGINCWSDEGLRSVMIKNNQITNNIVANASNTAYGGGLTTDEVNATVVGNNISDNELNSTSSSRGGGIFVTVTNGTINIDRNYITNNEINGGTFETGGGIFLNHIDASSNILITNNIISGNSALEGGGIGSRNSRAQTINNTIVNNNATVGGGIRTDNNQPIVLNTIIWGNSASSGPQISGTPNVRYSIIQGGFSGQNNLNIDPLFVQGDSLYRLTVTGDTSQCLNRGIGSIQIGGRWYYAPDHDFAGDPRPQPSQTRPDIGAWEYDVLNSLEELPNNQIPLKYTLKQNYPNPFNPSTTIKYTLPKSQKVKIEIFNLLGQKIQALLNKQMPAGSHAIEFIAKDLPSGIYFYRIEAGDPSIPMNLDFAGSTGSGQGFQEVKKMILMK